MLALLVYAFIYSNTKVVLREYSVASAELPEAFSGLRAAVVADTHGKFDQRTLDAVFDADPDIILLVGDIIDDAAQIPAAVEFAGALADRAPTYFVTGNHEWSSDARAFMAALDARGVRLMDNATAKLTRGEAEITIAGRADPLGASDMPSLAEVLAETGDGFVLLLSHRPADPDIFAEYGTDVIVSGHVHGGMVRLPGLGGIIGPGREFLPKYSGGVYSGEKGPVLVVTRGLAGVKFYDTKFHFPRLFNPREVVVITFTKG